MKVFCKNCKWIELNDYIDCHQCSHPSNLEKEILTTYFMSYSEQYYVKSAKDLNRNNNCLNFNPSILFKLSQWVNYLFKHKQAQK